MLYYIILYYIANIYSLRLAPPPRTSAWYYIIVSNYIRFVLNI